MNNLVRKQVRIGIIAVLCFIAAECASRFEDFAFEGLAFTANPTPDSQLIYADKDGVTRGKPGGRYRRWHLNQFGMRGPEISMQPAAGTTRVMVLGSSEAFGLYEPDGKEFPRQLSERLTRKAKIEVVNASLFGMTMRSLVSFWTTWAFRFDAQLVIIYPSPFFYLQDAILSRGRPFGSQTSNPVFPQSNIATSDNHNSSIWNLGFASRFINRLRDIIDMPEIIQRMRDERQIAALTADKPSGWLFTSPPTNCRRRWFGEPFLLLHNYWVERMVEHAWAKCD